MEMYDEITQRAVLLYNVLICLSLTVTSETCEINIGVPHFPDIQQIDECDEQICTGLYSALPALWIRLLSGRLYMIKRFDAYMKH